MPRSKLAQMERTLGMATRFLDDVRVDVSRSAPAGADIPPRVRCVHEKPGHTTPEFRTLAIPIPAGVGGVSPEILSGTLARFATTKKPDCMILAIEAVLARPDGSAGPVLIAEARDRLGTRLFWLQRYEVQGSTVEWSDPDSGGWQDPGEEELILDAAFQALAESDPPRPVGKARRARTPHPEPAVVVEALLRKPPGVGESAGELELVAAQA